MLPSQTYMTNVVSPIHYGEIIGDVAQGFAQSANAADTAPLDGGNLQFLINGVVVCTLPFITGKTQVCPPTTGAGYSVGTYVLSSIYTGNQIYASSSSPLYPVQVLPDDTQGVLASSIAQALAGTPVTLTATFDALFATPVGIVTFFDGATPIGAATLTAGGTASLITTNLAVGTHTIRASLGASLNFNPSSTNSLIETILPAPLTTSTVLASSVNPSTIGQNVTFSAAVAATGSSPGIPSGSVTFTIDGAAAGVVPLTGNGTANFSTGTLSLGSHAIIATYSGTAAGTGTSFSASTSSTLTEVVAAAPPAPSFTMTVTPAAISVPVGNSASVLVTVMPVGGFNQAVVLTCDALAREVTCDFSADTIANGNGTSTLRVTAAAPYDCNSSTPYFIASGSGSWLGLAAGAGLLVLLRRRCRLAKRLVLSLALWVLPTLTGCGHCTDLGVYPGTYSFKVTATTPTLTVTQTVKMVVHL